MWDDSNIVSESVVFFLLSFASVGERDGFSVLPEKRVQPCPTALQKTGGRGGDGEGCRGRGGDERQGRGGEG